MYRPRPVFTFGLFGIAGLYLFSAANTSAAFCAAAVCFGIYTGALSFYFVFHSLVHPERSARYISINEAIVGMSSITGPLIGGLVADLFKLPTSYLLAAGFLLPALVVQACLHIRLAVTPKREPA
jgi:MFS family permease